MYPVKVSGGKVVLREFRPADEDAILEIVGDERVTSWLSLDRRNRDGAAGHAPRRHRTRST